MKLHSKIKASRFYDAYHAKSAQKMDDDPGVQKTYWIVRSWLKKLAPAPGARVLDLSCGLGLFLKAAHDHDPSLQLHGLDHSEVACRQAAARVPAAKIRRGDAMKTPYPSGSFDLVTCLGSLEHYPDSGRGLAEIRRLLADGGKALVYVPNLFFIGYIYLVFKTGETPHEAGQNEYERFETRQGWEELIRANGLKVVDVTKHNEMYATDRVSGLAKFIYGFFVKPFVPMNLSYCFGYWLEKDPGFKSGNLNRATKRKAGN